MVTISATKARENIYELLKTVNMDATPITITNSRGKNAVIISEDDWNAIQETLFLNAIPGMTESIMDGGACPIDECVPEEEVEW